jgi:uncharacterized protein (UPF0335 family)
MSDIGHNSVAHDRLKAFIQKIEKLNEEKQNISLDINEIYSVAKSTGFDVKIIRKIISERKMDENKRREQQELLDLYKSAIGME